MSESLKALETQYLSLNSCLPDLMEKGATEKELEKARHEIERSRKNYWENINKAFHDDDPEVASLVSQMKDEQEELDSALKKLASVAKLLQVITKAVDVGSQLAAKAAAV